MNIARNIQVPVVDDWMSAKEFSNLKQINKSIATVNRWANQGHYYARWGESGWEYSYELYKWEKSNVRTIRKKRHEEVTTTKNSGPKPRYGLVNGGLS